MDSDSQAQTQIQALKELLQRTTDEKETLAMQYNNLLAKLTAMRTTLGNKLKQDAVRFNCFSVSCSSLTLAH